MSVVTYPKFAEKRVALEAHVFNELYSSVDYYIGLVQEHLNCTGNSSATAMLEKLLRVVDKSRRTSLSIDQRVEYVNIIHSGVSLLNIMMSVE